MRLYYTPNSPYARIVRVALRDAGVGGIEEIEARTRAADTDLFAVTPLARVPLLVDGDTRIGDTRDICAWIDTQCAAPRWLPPEDAGARFLRHVATGFLDGVAVWLRENARPDGMRSDPVMRYEEHRARHALTWLAAQGIAPDRWDFTALTLACAIDIAAARGMASDWRAAAPDLVDWAAMQARRPSMQATAPLPL
jgi:glutathione S-transferase